MKTRGVAELGMTPHLVSSPPPGYCQSSSPTRPRNGAKVVQVLRRQTGVIGKPLALVPRRRGLCKPLNRQERGNLRDAAASGSPPSRGRQSREWGRRTSWPFATNQASYLEGEQEHPMNPNSSLIDRAGLDSVRGRQADGARPRRRRRRRTVPRIQAVRDAGVRQRPPQAGDLRHQPGLRPARREGRGGRLRARLRRV